MISTFAAMKYSNSNQLGLLLAMEHSLHELSQPLTSIACAMELIGRESDGDISSIMLATAAQECGRAMEQVARSRELLADALAIATQYGKDMA